MTLNLQAATWTVSNNPSSPGQYTNLQTAIDAAAINDTIMVAGSATSYGNISFGKRLVLVGAGYHNPYGNNSTLGNVTLYRTNLYIGASGSKIMGFIITGNTYLTGSFSGSNSTTALCSNIVFERCQILSSFYFFYSTGSPYLEQLFKNDTIRNCIISGTVYFASYNTSGHGHFKDIYIHNNIFNGITSTNSSPFINFEGYNPTDFTNINIRNNVFINKLYSCFGSLSNMIIENNIFYAAEPQGGTGCVLTKNLTFMCLNNNIPGTGNLGSGNIINANPLFVNYPLAGGVGFSYTYDFHLQHPASPGYNAGTDGSDIGIYGGWAPFEVGANPYFPQMMELTLPNGSSVPAGGTLNVHFKARKQN